MGANPASITDDMPDAIRQTLLLRYHSLCSSAKGSVGLMRLRAFIMSLRSDAFFVSHALPCRLDEGRDIK